VTVQFEEARSYGIICHEYCGAAHHTMEGQLQVVPQSQFSTADLQNPEVASQYAEPDAAADGNEHDKDQEETD
jgi:cytochrome c oxidase subunit 2